jgi:hypothetical protein
MLTNIILDQGEVQFIKYSHEEYHMVDEVYSFYCSLGESFFDVNSFRPMWF